MIFRPLAGVGGRKIIPRGKPRAAAANVCHWHTGTAARSDGKTPEVIQGFLYLQSRICPKYRAVLWPPAERLKLAAYFVVAFAQLYNLWIAEGLRTVARHSAQEQQGFFCIRHAVADNIVIFCGV